MTMFNEYIQKMIGSIMIMGCGGGYDIFTGLPIYYAYHHKHQIYLGNFSFTKKDLLKKYGQKIGSCGYIIKKDIIIKEEFNYFPEYQLAKEIGIDIYCWIDEGLLKYEDTLSIIVKVLKINNIILCDG